MNVLHRRWPWLLAGVVALVVVAWLYRTPREADLARYREIAESRMPSQRTPTQHAIESGQLDAATMADRTRVARASTSAGVEAAQGIDAQASRDRARAMRMPDAQGQADPEAARAARSRAEAADARRRADEAIKVIEATTPEM